MSSRVIRTYLSFLLLFTASADAGAAEMYDSVDITPLVEHFRKQVVVLDRPITTYNWAPLAPTTWLWPWQSKPVITPETQLEEIRDGVKLFWQNYGSKKNHHMFGIGLYTALDPASTLSYGGEGDEWQLTEVRLAKGLNFLDFSNRQNVDLSDKAMNEATLAIEARFNCPQDLNAVTFFEYGGRSLDIACARLMHQVFRNVLRIDAFAYGYGATEYKECIESRNLAPAFVILSKDWMNSRNTRVFTKNSSDRTEDRIRIQTLVLKAGSDRDLKMGYSVKLNLIDYLKRHPDRDFTGSRTLCESDTCLIFAEFCDENRKCEEITLASLPRPGGPLITSEEATRTKLLWTDLIGKPKTSTISRWLDKNMYLCDGKFPYDVKKAN